MSMDAEKLSFFVSVFNSLDCRPPFDFKTYQKKDTPVPELLEMVEQSVVDTNEIIKKAIDSAGMYRNQFAGLVGLDAGQLAKSMKPGSTKAMPLHVMVNLSNSSNCSISNLLFHKEIPIELLLKHKLLLFHIHEWPESLCFEMANTIQKEQREKQLETSNNTSTGENEESNDSLRVLVAKRLESIANDRGIGLHYLVPNSRLRNKLRCTLDTAFNDHIFVGRVQALIHICAGGYISPDILLHRDYIRFVTSVSSINGATIQVRPGDKALLSTLISLPEDRENQIIGKLLSLY